MYGWMNAYMHDVDAADRQGWNESGIRVLKSGEPKLRQGTCDVSRWLLSKVAMCYYCDVVQTRCVCI